ncbi:MAG TPA: hypothetical protein VGI58_06635 [Streptosporangiaceae bacterium]|jgi:hypothetical protein
MNRNDASALADLQMNWDGAYAITFDGCTWAARFYGTTETLEARSSSDLRQQIRDDYAGRKLTARAGGVASPAPGDDPAADQANTEPVGTDPADPEPRAAERPHPVPPSSWPGGLRFCIEDDQAIA